MLSGVCPKCGSTEVYAGTEISYKAGNNYSNSIPITFWHTSALDNYVCADCGYVESYIPKHKHREMIRKNWPRVSDIKYKRMFD